MILYVEDNAQNMRLVRKMLKVGGYEMVGAEDGLKGLEMAKAHKPEIILMDINLPDIDGIEVTKRIKAQEHLNHIPIIALTANAMYGDEAKYIAAGCDGYIAKPVDKQKLHSEIERFLAKPEES